MQFLPFCMSRLRRETTSSEMSMIPGVSLSNDTLRGLLCPLPILQLISSREKLNKIFNRLKTGRPKNFVTLTGSNGSSGSSIKHNFFRLQTNLTTLNRLNSKLLTMSRKEALSQFINQIHGRAVVVKLNSGVDYRGQ